MDINIETELPKQCVTFQDLPCFAYHDNYEGLRLISEIKASATRFAVLRLSGPNAGTTRLVTALWGYRKVGPVTVTLKGE